MEFAFDQILMLLLQCLLIALLLLSLFRLRTIFGLGLLYISLGVFQFLQVFLASSFYIEVTSEILISSGSMVLFTGSLFAILLIYIREDALEARKIIYALLAANLVTALLLIIFGWSIESDGITNVYNLPKEFYTDNSRILVIGTLIFIFDAFIIIFLFEVISKWITSIFFRILFTMTVVLSVDTLLFTLGVFPGAEKFQSVLLSGLVSKNLAVVVYSVFFTFYLIYIDKKYVKSESESDSYKDIFNTLTFRQKYEDVYEKMQHKSLELQEAHEITQLGTYKLDLTSGNFTSSPIFDTIAGLSTEESKNHEKYKSIIHPEDLARNDELFSDCIEKNLPYNVKYRIFRNNQKELRWLHERGRVVYKNRKPFEFKGTVQDITEQMFSETKLKKQNEELIVLSSKFSEKNRLLKESRGKFKNLFDQNPVSLWEEDFSKVKQLLNDKIVYTEDLKKYLDDNPDFVMECISKVEILNVNDITLELFGVNNKKELINHLSNSFNQRSFEVFKEELIAIAQNKKEFSSETEFVKSNGEIITAIIKFVIIGESFDNAVISIVDITELNKAKEEIVKSEKKFRELYEKSSDSILIIKNGIFVDCNHAAVNLFEQKAKENLLKIDPSKISPKFQADGQKSIDTSREMINIALKNGTHRFEWIHVKKNGVEFPTEVLLTSISNESNNAVIHTVIRDISDRKKIKEQLIKSEEKFSKAYFNNPIPIFMSSIPDGEFIDANSMFEQVSGHSREELIGKKVTDLNFYENEEDRIKLFEELKNKGRLHGYEINFKVKNGELRNCLMNAEIIEIDGNASLISIISDITEQKKADILLKNQNEELTILGKKLSDKNRSLKESQRNFKNLFDKNPVSLWEEDYSEVKRLLIKKKSETNDLKKYLDENPDFVIECISKLEILNVNDISLKLFGVNDKQELISRLDKTFNENSIEGFKKQLVAITQNMKEFSSESELIGRNGKIINVLVKFVNISDANKAIVSIIDITELNKAKEEIEESEKRFRELYEKSGDAILIIKNGIFIECNQATVDMLEYKSREEFLNSHPSKLSPIFQQDGQKSFDKAVEMMKMALQQGTHRFEWIHTKKNGENFPVEVLLTAISKDPNNQIIHTVWRDITDRKMAELKLNKINRLYATLSEINKTIITEVDKLKLFQQICNIAINSGKFRLAWIGLVDEINGSIEPAVFSGDKTDYLQDFKISLEKKFQAKGPTARAITEGQSIVFNDLENNPDFKPWRKKAVEKGYRSSGAFPIKVNNSVIGVFNVYAFESHFFDQDEIDLMEEAALNISFALEKFDEEERRKKAETTLKNSELELRNSQEIAQLGTFNLDLTTQLFKSSSIFDAILGFKPGDTKKLASYQATVHPEDFPENQKMLEECIKTGKSFDREYRIFTKNTKELKWIHALGEIIHLEGKPTHFRGTIQNITARKLSELEVKLNEQKLIEVQKIANLGTYELDLISNSISTSPIYRSILGMKKSPKKNKGWWKSITYPEDYERSEQLWQQCIKDCTIYNDEYRIVTDKNEIKWIHDIAEVKCENGVAAKIVGTIQDISQQKVYEKKIRRSDAILNQLNSLVKVVDKKGNVTYASPSFKTILGYEPEEILGQGWWVKTTADLESANKLRDTITNINNSSFKLSVEIRNRWIKTKDGKLKLIDWVTSRGDGGSLIFTGLDVTEKEIAEKNIIQYWKIVEDSLNEIYIFDAETFKFIQVSRGARQNIGYSLKELEKLTPMDIKPKYTKQLFEELLKPLQTGKSNRILFTTEHERKNGSRYIAEINIQRSELKLKPVFIASVNDVTESQREEQIKEVIYQITKYAQNIPKLAQLFPYVKKSLNTVIDTSNFIVELYDEQTESFNIPYRSDTELDDKSKGFYNFPKEKSFSGYVIDTKKPFLSSIRRSKSLIKKGITKEMGKKSKCWLGVPLIVDKKAIGVMVVQDYINEDAFTQQDGILLELVASNISKVIKQSQDLEQIQLLNKALIHSPLSVIMTNIKGEIEYTNPAFTKLSGFTEAEALGMNPRILNSGDQSSEYYKNLWQTITKGNTWEGEFVNQRKDGSTYLVETNISSVRNKDGKITHYIGVQEDITEKRKLQRQFINAFIEAQEIEKQAFGEELHDGISQILSAEAMYIDLLIEQNQDRIHDKAKFLTKIRELNSRAVNETRNIAHGLMSSELKQSGLLISVENICIDFNITKNINFKFSNKDVEEKELSEEIKTNLFRIIQELTTNIIRYSSARSASIKFSKLNRKKIKLTVKDDGIGMDYDKILKDRKGTGLKNVERRITFLNGSFEIESNSDQGTTWNIIIPL